jgi:hypothetical protein
MTEKKRKAPRGRRPLPEGERKGRVVQTRVPDDLNEALRDEARKRRVSVSQLIRNVLEDTFNLVDNVVAGAQSLGRTVKRDALQIAASARGQARASATAAYAYAYEEVVVNVDMTCTSCAKTIRRGQKAMRGLSDDPRVKDIRCPACVVYLTSA